MITFQDAISIIKSSPVSPKTETVDLLSANRRVLAQDVLHDMDMPPFDKSAMDGFACKREDLGKELELMETIYAGKTPEIVLQSDQCSKIMTGAMLPEGADCVFMQEDSEALPNGKIVCRNTNSKTNICKLGEDIQEGEKVMDKGTLLSARHIPTLAGAGIDSPLVYSQARVCVLATGSELVEPGNIPVKSQIRNSNSSQLLAQLNNLGITGNYGGIVPDTPEDTERMISESLQANDVIILTGGVSVGEYDFTQDILKQLGFEVLISTIATQPGKPLVFARKGKQYAFGLAGNPVSSYIQFELYVKTFLYTWMNYDYVGETRTAVLSNEIKRKKADRFKLIPAICDEKNNVKLINYHGSAHINALSAANCLIDVPLGIALIQSGEEVSIRPLF